MKYKDDFKVVIYGLFKDKVTFSHTRGLWPIRLFRYWINVNTGDFKCFFPFKSIARKQTNHQRTHNEQTMYRQSTHTENTTYKQRTHTENTTYKQCTQTNTQHTHNEHTTKIQRTNNEHTTNTHRTHNEQICLVMNSVHVLWCVFFIMCLIIHRSTCSYFSFVPVYFVCPFVHSYRSFSSRCWTQPLDRNNCIACIGVGVLQLAINMLESRVRMRC